MCINNKNTTALVSYLLTDLVHFNPLDIPLSHILVVGNHLFNARQNTGFDLRMCLIQRARY